jgi:hypothetical protein
VAVVVGTLSAGVRAADDLGQLRDAVVHHLAGRTVLLGSGTDAPAVRVGTDGRPVLIRRVDSSSDGVVVRVSAFTRQPAVYCSGGAAPGKLVIEYENHSGTWSAHTRHSTPLEPFSPLFAMVAGDVPWRDAGIGTIDGRACRRVSANWAPPSFSTVERSPDGTTSALYATPSRADLTGTQTLSIDLATMLPVRWRVVGSIGERGALPPLDYDFRYDDSVKLEEPENVRVDRCIQ